MGRLTLSEQLKQAKSELRDWKRAARMNLSSSALAWRRYRSIESGLKYVLHSATHEEAVRWAREAIDHASKLTDDLPRSRRPKESGK